MARVAALTILLIFLMELLSLVIVAREPLNVAASGVEVERKDKHVFNSSERTCGGRRDNGVSGIGGGCDMLDC